MTDRERHLDRLADEFIAQVEWEGESYFGLDGKRPWGFSSVYSSTLDLLDIDPSGPDGHDDDQINYASELMNDLPDHLRRRWSEFRGMVTP